MSNALADAFDGRLLDAYHKYYEKREQERRKLISFLFFYFVDFILPAFGNRISVRRSIERKPRSLEEEYVYPVAFAVRWFC